MFSFQLFATHNIAGEIIFQQINETTIEATVITYTALEAVAADRDSLWICWGDGACEPIGRTNGPNNEGVIIGNGMKMNEYTRQHTYPGLAHYQISVEDPNRTGGILNVNPPNSDLISFKIITELTLFNQSFNSPNNSPILLQPPVDIAFTEEPFFHTPNAFDLDGDSISYELIAPLNVTNYIHVTDIGPGPNNNLTMNEETGLLVWDSPQVVGLYTIAYKVKSFRNGAMIDFIVRDMMIEVQQGSGFAPDITVSNITGNEEKLLVQMGDTVELEIEVNDPDVAQEVTLTSTCGLYDFFDNHATFDVVPNGNSATATFRWIVEEEHLRHQPYQLVIKAEDDSPAHVKSKLAVVRFKTLGVPTSIVEPSVYQELKIFPNPVTDGVLNFNFQEIELLPERFRIYDSTGREMLSGSITSTTFQVEVDRLASGMYFLILEKDGELISGNFMIQ